MKRRAEMKKYTSRFVTTEFGDDAKSIYTVLGCKFFPNNNKKSIMKRRAEMKKYTSRYVTTELRIVYIKR